MEDGYINLLSAARKAEEGGGGSLLLALLREERWQMGSYLDRQPTTLDRRSTIIKGLVGFREALTINILHTTTHAAATTETTATLL